MQVFITGSGTNLPDNIVTNGALAERLGLEPDQIFKSSGIRQRHWAGVGTTTSSLAASALKHAIDDAGISTSDLDYLLFGTMTADRFIPGCAPSVQRALELREIPCIDIRAACCNALYGLQLARALVASGVARQVAVALAEIQSPYLDLSPAAGTTSMLFGDGAAAFIVSAEPQSFGLEIVDVFLATDGRYVDDLGIRCPGSEFGNASGGSPAPDRQDYSPRMLGHSVILHASRRMLTACQTVLGRNDLTAKDVRWVVPHQANANLIAQVARGLGISTTATEVINVIENTGNTSSASMGIALDTLRRSGSVRDGDYVLMPAFAAGFTWGAALCRASIGDS